MDVNVAMLNEEMAKKGWTISDLAVKSNVDKSTIVQCQQLRNLSKL